MLMCLRTKFYVSSIISTSFKQDIILPTLHTSERTPKKPTEIRVKNKFKTLFERLLRTFYVDSINSFEDLLKKDKSHTTNRKNLNQ